MKLKKHPEIESLIDSPTDNELAQLETNLLRDGCREALDLWNDIILDGHHRYDLCLKHGIEFNTAQVDGIETIEDAVNWVIDKQFGRRNSTPEQKSYLRGKRYEQEKKAVGASSGKKTSKSDQNDHLSKTADKLAAEYKVSAPTIRRDAQFAQSVDELVDIAGSEIRAAVLKRDAKITKKTVIDLAAQKDLTPEKVKAELGIGASQEVGVTIFSSKSEEYYTPPKYIEAAREVMGDFDLDPASCAIAQEWIKAESFYAQADNGLVKEWHGRVWLNPPYGKTGGKSNQELWAQKLIGEYETGNVREAILLVKAALGYKWFESLWYDWPVCFARERLSFIKSDGSNSGQSKQGTAFFYFGNNVEKFKEVFSRFGRVIMPEVGE